MWIHLIRSSFKGVCFDKGLTITQGSSQQLTRHSGSPSLALCALYGSRCPKTKFFYESAPCKQYMSVNKPPAVVIISNYREDNISQYIFLFLSWFLILSCHSLGKRLSSHTPPYTPPRPSQLVNAPIGFSPSSEIFRWLSVRKPLLRGLFVADFVDFQNTSYAHHFRRIVSLPRRTSKSRASLGAVLCPTRAGSSISGSVLRIPTSMPERRNEVDFFLDGPILGPMMDAVHPCGPY